MQNKQDSYEINIASGALKGRKITLLSSEKTRSTKSIVADSFFDSLRDEVRDSVFAELFGGCGLMAVRALSDVFFKAFRRRPINSFYEKVAGPAPCTSWRAEGAEFLLE